MQDSGKLRAIKVVHTIIWAFFALAIIAIPIAAARASFAWACAFTAVSLSEVAVLAMNGMRCPLTDIASRFTEDRRPNFDIFLPLALARHNKRIFGSLLIGGLLYSLFVWIGRSS